MPENPPIEDPVLLKRLAKYIVQQCFRNTVLEEYHAGTVPVLARSAIIPMLW